jgi:tRNA threonylcarbamoyladenosine biosynthesis protein TsaE
MNNTHSASFSLANMSDTDRLGQLIADTATDGTTIGFTGTLGSGKTRLIQAIAAASGVDPANVTSPTYVLCHIYHGSRVIYHLDVYRLRDTDEFLELGVEEMFESTGLTLVEWADRVEEVLPLKRLTVDLQIHGSDERLARIEGPEEYRPIISRLQEAWPACHS